MMSYVASFDSVEYIVLINVANSISVSVSVATEGSRQKAAIAAVSCECLVVFDSNSVKS
jgi:hypothetical protein